MPVDFLTLLRRDHTDLQTELSRLLDPETSIGDLRNELDGVRLGLTAHAEAEDIVLGRFEVIRPLQSLIANARAAHRAQESVLASLVCSRPQTPVWRDCAQHLRELVGFHADQEERTLLPALRQYAPEADYRSLAGAFATQRLRQLAMLQPSAPVLLPDRMQMRAY